MLRTGRYRDRIPAGAKTFLSSPKSPDLLCDAQFLVQRVTGFFLEA